MAREESQRGIQHDVNVYVHGLDGHKSRRLEPKHLSSLKKSFEDSMLYPSETPGSGWKRVPSGRRYAVVQLESHR